MESILTSIKKMLGITEDYKQFDPDIIMCINSVFVILNQMGVGPSEGFRIDDEYATWSNFIPDDKDDSYLDLVKSYMAMKVKLLFDPPQSSIVMEATNRMISEAEWRLYVAADSYGKEEIQNE